MNPAQVGPQQKADLDKAAVYFLRYLERSPDNLGFKWLLNMTYMLSGEYPAAVPEKFTSRPRTVHSRKKTRPTSLTWLARPA